jgi:hypothetical protein
VSLRRSVLIPLTLRNSPPKLSLQQTVTLATGNDLSHVENVPKGVVIFTPYGLAEFWGKL